MSFFDFFRESTRPSGPSPLSPPVRPLIQRSVTCPFCLERTAVDGSTPKCQVCEKDLPPLYLERPLAPLPIQVFGWGEHGKTVFLAALTMMLQRLNTVWTDPDYTCIAATDASQRKVREVNEYFRTGKIPSFTTLGLDECFVMLMEGIVPWGSRALLIRDCSGEAFNGLDVNLDEAKFLLKAMTTLMFVSLPDLADSGGYSIDLLMSNYLNTLVKHGVRLERERRKIVLILTKADLFLQRLPQELFDYVQDDALGALLKREDLVTPLGPDAMQNYLEVMRKASQAIEEWVRRSAAGRTLTTLAKQRNVEMHFCLVSSTGSKPGPDNSLAASWAPRRVLDPFFWTLMMENSTPRS